MRHLKHISLKVAAAVLGIALAGAPVLWFDGWLKRQGDSEAALTAGSAVRAAEAQIGQTVAMLRELSAHGVEACRPAHQEAMRQAMLRTGPVKEVVVLAPGGQVACSDSGTAGGRQPLIVSVSTASPDIMLDVIQPPDRGERFLRVRKTGSRTGSADKTALAALVPASLLLPRALIQGGRFAGEARLTVAGGTLVGTVEGGGGSVPQDTLHRAEERSPSFGFRVAVATPRNGVIATYDDLRRIGMVATGLFALLILICALLLPWRRPISPVGDLAKAILAKEFVPYYQPIVDIQTGRLLGAEVLARWRRADGSFVEAAAFMALMETSGLALDLTRSLMRRVRGEMGEAVGRRPAMTIAFNVSVRHFDDALILNDVGTVFDGAPIKLQQIVLELTERSEIGNAAGLRRTIAALQGMGCKVAIDDVGAGHGGLSHILKLGVDIVKIDRPFVEALSLDGAARTIVETLIDLAKNMRMQIVAEGVETFDQVTCLREHGIGAAQGYVFAPPLPASAFVQLLDAMEPVAGQGGPTLDKAGGKKPAGQAGAGKPNKPKAGTAAA